MEIIEIQYSQLLEVLFIGDYVKKDFLYVFIFTVHSYMNKWADD